MRSAWNRATVSGCDVDCNNTDYLRFYTPFIRFFFSGIWLSIQICVFVLPSIHFNVIFFSFSLPSLSLTHAFFLPLSLFGCLFPPICSFLCVKIYVTRGCVGSLYSISQSLCKYYVALIVIEIIYLLRILRVCDACCVRTPFRAYVREKCGGKSAHTQNTQSKSGCR